MTDIIRLPRGDSVEMNLTFPEDVDIAGYSILFTVKSVPDADPTDSKALIKAEATVTGERSAQISLTPEETTIPPRTYRWDLLLTAPDGTRRHTSTGDFVVESVITNREA